jgi:hypothetical protein
MGVSVVALIAALALTVAPVEAKAASPVLEFVPSGAAFRSASRPPVGR